MVIGGVLFSYFVATRHMTRITYLNRSSSATAPLRLCRRKAMECQRTAMTTTNPVIRSRILSSGEALEGNGRRSCESEWVLRFRSAWGAYFSESVSKIQVTGSRVRGAAEVAAVFAVTHVAANSTGVRLIVLRAISSSVSRSSLVILPCISCLRLADAHRAIYQPRSFDPSGGRAVKFEKRPVTRSNRSTCRRLL